MKKVLFTATVDSHILAFHLPFLKYFKSLGYEVHVATGGGVRTIPYCDKKYQIPFERNPLKINNIKAIQKLRKILEKERYELIHTNTPMGSVVTRFACKKMKGKKPRLIYMAHGLHFYKGASIKNWLLYYPVEKYLSKYTDTLILINKEDYNLAKRKFKKCNVEYVPGVGIDQEKFNFEMSPEKQKEIRSSLGLNMEDFVLIYPAELNKNKNQILLIEAMEELVNRIPNIHLLLPGLDSYNGYYQKLVLEKRLESKIHFLGFRKDIPQLLKISNLAVATSQREGLAVNIMEAMTSSLPVVATDVRGQRDLIKNEETGFLISNKIELINAIELLYQKKDLYQKMQQNSKKESEKYQLEKILKEMISIYQQKKTVLHVLKSNKYSGAENVILTIIDNTKDYNSIYCCPNGPIKEILESRNVPFFPLEKLSKKEIKRAIKELKPDIVHAHDFRASYLVNGIKGQFKKICQLHQNPLWMKKWSAKSLLFRICSNNFQKIILVSSSLLKECVYQKSIAQKCIELQNIVEKETVLNLAKEPYWNHFDVAFFGRIVKPKNPMEFLQIIKEYEKKYSKKLSVCFVGDGELKEECKTLIKNMKFKSTFEFLGFQENPFKIIKQCKCIIMPSIYEGFGLTAVESMILKCPVLNSGVGGLREIFSDCPWYICKERKEYVEKLHTILEEKRFEKIDLNKYTNKEEYKKKIKEIYEE